jgi:hypothetical protein
MSRARFAALLVLAIGTTMFIANRADEPSIALPPEARRVAIYSDRDERGDGKLISHVFFDKGKFVDAYHRYDRILKAQGFALRARVPNRWTYMNEAHHVVTVERGTIDSRYPGGWNSFPVVVPGSSGVVITFNRYADAPFLVQVWRSFTFAHPEPIGPV